MGKITERYNRVYDGVNVLEKIFNLKNKEPKFKEVASNKNKPIEELSKQSNHDIYLSQLTSLAGSFFIFQSSCAKFATQNELLSANVLYNAYNSYGAPTTQPIFDGAVTFKSYCNAVKQNPNIDCTLRESHNANIFANNFLNNPAVNQKDLGRDIAAIDTVLNAVLATADGKINVDIPQNEDSSGILNFEAFKHSFDLSPKYAFDNGSFTFPNGVQPPLSHTDLQNYSQGEISDALTVLSGAERILIGTAEQYNYEEPCMEK